VIQELKSNQRRNYANGTTVLHLQAGTSLADTDIRTVQMYRLLIPSVSTKRTFVSIRLFSLQNNENPSPDSAVEPIAKTLIHYCINEYENIVTLHGEKIS